MNFRVAGIILLCVAGFFYTLERIVAYFSTYVSSIGKVGISVDLTILYPSVFSNPFVLIFVVLGFVFLVVGFIKKK